MTQGADPPDPWTDPVAAVRWFLSTDHEGVAFLREVLHTVTAVAMVGLLLFAVSGVWPPMVAVESGSMEPHMTRGDLVFVMDEHRFPPAAATGETGVVTASDGRLVEYQKSGDYGDVVIFRPDGSDRETPIIHRARFWVDEGENWYHEADPQFVPDRFDGCDALPDCPAPHAGFITKGDANPFYDQTQDISSVVRPEWIRGTAELRIPFLGHVRLVVSNLLATAGPPSPVASSAILPPAVVAAGAAG